MRNGFLGGGIGPTAIKRRTAPRWWTAGGAPTPIAAYQPKGAASLAASYVNLANPGTYDATVGVVPALTADGWQSVATASYLRTGITAESTWVVICRFSGGGTGYKFGSYKTTGTVIQGTAKSPAANYFWNGTGLLQAGSSITDGTVAIAGNQAYVDGVAVGTITGLANTGLELWIMGLNAGGVPDQRFAGTISAIAIYDTNANHAVWVPAVSAAMAAL